MAKSEIAVKSFSNIQVVPYEALLNKPRSAGSLLKGGPHWPNWQAEGFERHWWDDKPVDDPPSFSEAATILDLPDLFWAGAISVQFGHQVMDFSMRVLSSRFARPGAKFLFALPAASFPRPANWFAALMEWMDVGQDDIHIISSAVLAKNLHVVPQAERLRQGGPEPAHLERMDRFIAAKRLALEKVSQALYVSRAGQGLRFGGESYLEAAIMAAGGHVIRPEQHSIREQITTYMNAGRLIFAEGSSLHILSLAGRQFADIDVLMRGRGVELAAASTAPRCANLSYIDCVKANLGGVRTGKSKNLTKSFPIFDEARLLDYFASRGLALASHWDHARFALQVVDDFAEWLAADWRLLDEKARPAMQSVLASIEEDLATDASLAASLCNAAKRIGGLNN